MGTISRKQPLYDQLIDVLRDKIENEMAPDDLLPSERELSEHYGISRTTVRLAMKELETMGLVSRKHGKGTFVSDISQVSTNLMSTYSFTEQMKELGREPQTKVLEFRIVEASKSVAEGLGIRIGERVFYLHRLRLADGIPMMVERSYLPVSSFVSLTLEDVSSKPLYDIIEQDYHEIIRLAEEQFYASIARGTDAEALEINEGAPVLRLIRTTYNDKNMVIEYTLSVARADQFTYKISHVRS